MVDGLAMPVSGHGVVDVGKMPIHKALERNDG